MNVPGTRPLRRPGPQRPADRMARPRLGILDFHPIQYHTPLYQHPTVRERTRLDVLYLNDQELSPVLDPGFGVPIAWNIDLLSGYGHGFLPGPEARIAADRRPRRVD